MVYTLPGCQSQDIPPLSRATSHVGRPCSDVLYSGSCTNILQASQNSLGHTWQGSRGSRAWRPRKFNGTLINVTWVSNIMDLKTGKYVFNGPWALEISHGWWGPRTFDKICLPVTMMFRMAIAHERWLQQGSWGQHGAHLGPTGPRGVPCWPYEPCYQGSLTQYKSFRLNMTKILISFVD